jgi:hypothetical protein
MFLRKQLFHFTVSISILSILYSALILQNSQFRLENERSSLNRSIQKEELTTSSPEDPDTVDNLVTSNAAVSRTSLGDVNHKRVQSKIRSQNILDELNILSGGLEAKSLECPHPLVPFKNIIVRNDNSTSAKSHTAQKIPKTLHFSMKSRCLPRDLARTLDRWHEALPDYSIFFHDDAAVDRLIGQETSVFPGLQKAMRCILFKGAMKIDVWRILLLHKYGGVYSDIDNWPLSAFNETTIRTDLSAFFFTDAWDRPSQWFMAAEPYHPIMNMTVHQIIKNVLSMDNIRNPRTVFVTGPDALKKGYQKFLSSPISSNETLQTGDVMQSGTVKSGLYNKQVLKTSGNHIITSKHEYDHIFPFNSTMNETRAERIARESGIQHWTVTRFQARKKMKQKVPRCSCKQYLERVDEGSLDEIQPF